MLLLRLLITRTGITAVDSIHANDRHLFTTAAEAIADNEHVFKIVWNSNGIDIARLVNTHRTNIDKEGTHSKWDVRAADGTVEKYGFKYSYELVGYHKGNNETSESAHAACMKGSAIRPQMTSGGKQQPWGFTQNKATKDREPLVRVILTDTISGKIASVGYLKFKITDTANQNEVVLTPNFPFANGYTVDCTETETKLGLSWHHRVEEQFWLNWKKLVFLRMNSIKFQIGWCCRDVEQQESFAMLLSMMELLLILRLLLLRLVWFHRLVGSADEISDFDLVIKNNQAYHIFKAGAKSIAVNVRYSYEVSEGVYQYVYVTFTWTPSPLNFTPNGTIENSAKIDKYWYEKNGAVAGSGYSDIHANVHQVVSDNSNDCTFDSEILNTFTGNVITVTSDATYPAFAMMLTKVVFANPQDHLTKKGTAYVVNGASGAQYDITVSADGKTLQATNNAVTKQLLFLLEQ